MTTKREAQAALEKLEYGFVGSESYRVIQSLIDAMPDDPESREERLGRVCREAYADHSGKLQGDPWIAAAAAVEAECKPREVTADWMRANLGFLHTTPHELAKINRYVRGEAA